MKTGKTTVLYSGITVAEWPTPVQNKLEMPGRTLGHDRAHMVSVIPIFLRLATKFCFFARDASRVVEGSW